MGAWARIVLPPLVGAAAGYALRALLDQPVPVPPEAIAVLREPPVVVAGSFDDAKADEVIAGLRNRIELLESELAETAAVRPAESGTSPEAAEKAVPGATPPRGIPSPRERREEYFERLKEESPERYAEIQRRMDGFRRHMEEVSENRRAFLASIDVSGMSEEQQASHGLLLEAIAKVDGYRMRFGPDSPAPLTEEERKDYFETRRAVGEMLEGDRRYLLESLGAGYGEDGAAFADYVEAVLEYTSPRGFGRRAKGGHR